MQAQLIRFDFWLDPVFDATIQASPAVALNLCRFEDPPAQSWQVMTKAHAYHICAARDEVPHQWLASEQLLERAPNLLCISSSGAGYDPIDVAACSARGVLVVNQSGCNADSVAEHTLGLLLSVKHRIAESDRVMRAAQYGTREDLMGHEIKGLTLGIVGVGQIGSRVAKLGLAFGMKVLGFDPYVDPKVMAEHGLTPVDWETLLAQSDVISLHCPRTDETLNLFDAASFAKMRRGAVFLSTARGGIHDEPALADALESSQLAGAGLDVWTVEPPAAENRLLAMPNVVATYHTAGVTHEARRNAARMGAEQLCELFAKGTRPKRLVNPDAWPAFEARFKRMFG